MSTDDLTKGPPSVDEIREVLRNVIDPEIHYNIMDIGLIYDVGLNDAGEADIQMTLTSPGCPYGPMIIHDVKENVKSLGISQVNIEVVWDPPWSPEKMSDEAKLELGFDL
ncbi:MAG: metal-sulfur cluster biosynthetic enzyme [Candidatus Omnitrophota bacterium]|jgi:metal-sulfur cluster biosynthetic enzyme